MTQIPMFDKGATNPRDLIGTIQWLKQNSSITRLKDDLGNTIWRT